MGGSAFAFPGVGVRFSGHEAAFFDRHRGEMEPLLVQASDYCGADLIEPLREDEPTALGEFEDQFFSYAFGCAVARVFRRHGHEPAATAGYSLGLYAALETAGAVAFDTGLELVRAADEIMRGECKGGSFALGVVVGLGRDEIDELLGDADPARLRRINSNNPTSKVFSGARADVEALLAAAEGRDAIKAILMPSAVPYHHPGYLGDAARRFGEVIRSLPWQPPRCPVVSSIDATNLATVDELRTLTARNLDTPIHWERVVEATAAIGVDRVLECGAGISLTQNARLVDDSPRFVNVKNAGRRLGL